MRVTQATTASLMTQSIDDTFNQFQTVSAQIASGLAITKPSDNPAGTVQALSYKAEITRLGQYQSNASDGLAWLGSADGALSNMSSQLDQVHTLLIQASNGSVDSAARSAIADQVDNIAASLLSEANTTYLGRPVFGGTTGNPAAYDAAGNYLGDNGSVNRTVAAGTSVAVNVVGTTMLGNGATSLFGVLSQISNDLRSNNPAQLANLGLTDLNQVQGFAANVRDAQAVVGSRYNEIQSLQNQAQSRQTTVTAALSSVQDLDMAKAETQLATDQLTSQAALVATSKVLSLSLADFLR